MDFAGVLIFEFDQAAARAPVTQRFPFAGRHLVQRFGFPKWECIAVHVRLDCASGLAVLPRCLVSAL